MNMMTPEDIRRIRVGLGLTGRQFADRLGVHIDTIWKWERGERHPTYEKMVKLNKIEAEIRKQPA